MLYARRIDPHRRRGGDHQASRWVGKGQVHLKIGGRVYLVLPVKPGRVDEPTLARLVNRQVGEPIHQVRLVGCVPKNRRADRVGWGWDGRQIKIVYLSL